MGNLSKEKKNSNFLEFPKTTWAKGHLASVNGTGESTREERVREKGEGTTYRMAT